MKTEWTWRGILIHNLRVSLKAILVYTSVIILALLYGFLGFGFLSVHSGLTTWGELVRVVFIEG